MFRRRFLQLAAACIILPALQWVPMPDISRDMTLQDLIQQKQIEYMTYMAEVMESYFWGDNDTKIEPPGWVQQLS